METVELNNGIFMPMVGYGTYQTAPAVTTKNVLRALRTGYRLIDTAQYYGNEAEVGEALTESGLPRDQVFVTTKVQTSGYAATKQGLDESLRRFNHDYFDLVIIHWPTGNDAETYRALEDAYRDGKVRALGLSNFNAEQVQSIIDGATVMPALDQIETHLNWQQKRMHAYLTSRGMIHESYAPLGEGQRGFLDNPTLVKMADRYHKTPAQVTLRFLVQEGIVVIPKTLNPQHMVDNFNIDDFTIDPADVRVLESLDSRQSIDGWPAAMQEDQY